MEANKYYTPKVEEFHVGFEYEVLQFLGHPIFDKVNGSIDLSTVEHTWLQQKVKFLSDVAENFCVVYSGGEKTQESIGNSIRVKYLDREDIESLGFKFNIQLTERNSQYIRDSITLVFNPENGHVRMAYEGLRSHVVLLDTKELKEINYTVLFNGLLKNKSELKKQLEIIERKIYEK